MQDIWGLSMQFVMSDVMCFSPAHSTHNQKDFLLTPGESQLGWFFAVVCVLTRLLWRARVAVVPTQLIWFSANMPRERKDSPRNNNCNVT